jgi:phosphatidylglycerophosphate synthase
MKAFQRILAARRWAADAVSLSRLLLLVPLVRFMIIGSPWAPVILAAIVASDLLDGPIARRLGTAGSRGALIDASCDVLVVMSAAMAAALSDARYAGLAAVMSIAFLSYGALSLIVGRFAYTRLGRYDGVVSYSAIAVASARPLFALIGVTMPSAAEWVILCISALFLAISSAENVGRIVAAIESRSKIAPRSRSHFAQGLSQESRGNLPLSKEVS